MLQSLLWVALLLPACLHAQMPDYGPDLELYHYPYPVKKMHAKVQGQDVQLAYMDVAAPANTAAPVVMLLHGKNFPGAYWRGTISVLHDAGFRVVVPDALGFGKSSKPVIQYSLSLLALLDRQLLDTLGIGQVMVVGHSMGGMIAGRFALNYPDRVSKLVLEDPLGLEDWRAKGAPVQQVDELYARERKATYESIRDYHKGYYPEWQPAYEEWVKVQASFSAGPAADRNAWVSALTMDMILSQPVLYEFARIKCPVMVVVGNADKTKVARDAPAAVMARLGHYRELGRQAAAQISGAAFVSYDGVGHIPHLQVPERFHKHLIFFLETK